MNVRLITTTVKRGNLKTEKSRGLLVSSFFTSLSLAPTFEEADKSDAWLSLLLLSSLMTSSLKTESESSFSLTFMLAEVSSFSWLTSDGSLNITPRAEARQNSALVILNVPLHPITSIRNCMKGPKIRTPMLPPTATTPTARDWRLRKFFAAIRNEAIKI